MLRSKHNILDKVRYRYGLDEIPFDITKQELLSYFSFTEDQKAFINRNCRMPSSRIALAIQLGAYKFIGRSQLQPEKAPPSLIRFVSRELELRGDFIPLDYSNRSMTRWNHDYMARHFLKLSYFSPQQHHILFDHLIKISLDPGHFPDWIKKAEDFLRERKFVLPSVKVLKRLVSSARDQSLEKVLTHIYNLLGVERINKLELLLQSEDEARSKWFGLTNKNIYSATTTKLSEILNRIKEVRELSLNNIDLSGISEQYLRYLSHQGLHLSVKQLKKRSPIRKYSTMAVALKALESEFTDIVIQMNDEILSGIFLRGKQRSKRYLQKYRRTIYQALSAFNFMSDTILNETMKPAEKFKHIEQKFPSDKLKTLREQTDSLNIPRGSEEVYFASGGYQTIQKYLPQLLETIVITSPSKHDPVVEAAQYFLERKQEGKTGIGSDAPTDFVQEKRWKQIVFDSDGKPKIKPWIVCLGDRLRKSFRQGSLEVEGARQYRSLNSDLIPWAEWNVIEKKENDTFPFTVSAEKAVVPLFKTIQRFSSDYERWVETNSVTIDEKNRLHLRKFDKIEEPQSAEKLRRIIQNRMPRRSLSEILVEADSLTSYSFYLTRLSSGQPIRQEEKMPGQALYATLLASTCNIPLYKIALSSGISLELLETIREDIIRPQTLQAAMAALVDFHARLPLAQIWGSGKTSSSDGQGFPAEGRPLGALFNPKRFRKRGFIIYTHILDTWAPFYTQVIPALVREAPYVLDGLLYHGTSLMPREHYTDSHGFTDIVFALMYLLGYRLAPRMANVPSLTLWYGKGYEIACPHLFDGRISLQSITSQWEAIQRIGTTIQSGKTRASQIIRKISASSKKHPLFKALRNLGRLVRTSHTLEFVGDKEFRQKILHELNKGESRNALAIDLRYARRGSIREKDPEMQLCAASSLNLTILCIAVWNTIHIQKIVRSLLQQGHEVTVNDLRFLSPFAHEHINFYGYFRFQPVPDTNLLSIEREFDPLC